MIDARYLDIAGQVVSSRETLFGAALGSSRAEGEQIIRKVGPKNWPSALGKSVQIRPGPVRRHGDRLLVGFSWEAHGGALLFPRLDADLEVAPFGPDETVLTIRGTYDPPTGVAGQIADDLVLHRVAESTIRAFLNAICAQLTRAPISS